MKLTAAKSHSTHLNTQSHIRLLKIPQRETEDLFKSIHHQAIKSLRRLHQKIWRRGTDEKHHSAIIDTIVEKKKLSLSILQQMEILNHRDCLFRDFLLNPLISVLLISNCCTKNVH